MNNSKVTIESLSASDAFQKYCLNPDASDIEYWNQWLIENEAHRATFEAAKQVVQQLSFQLPATEIQQELQSLKHQLNTKITPKRALLSRRRVLGIAASFLLLLGAWGLYKTFSPQPMVEVITAYGETQTFELPDQSLITLNANSKLSYPKNWRKGRARSVWLEGEAWFEVVHQPKAPFTVFTNQGDIQVLGTSFNVQKRAQNLQVTLVEGKVNVAFKNAESFIMNPGEQVTLQQGVIKKTQADVEAATAWRLGKLIFRNASIASIVDRLQNEYGWTIQVKKEALLERKVNASIAKNNPELLLEALREIYEFDIRKIQEGFYEIH